MLACLLSIQFSHHPTLFMTHKVEGTEYIFSFFSVESQTEGFLSRLSSLNLQSEDEKDREKVGEIGARWDDL